MVQAAIAMVIGTLGTPLSNLTLKLAAQVRRCSGLFVLENRWLSVVPRSFSCANCAGGELMAPHYVY